MTNKSKIITGVIVAVGAAAITFYIYKDLKRLESKGLVPSDETVDLMDEMSDYIIEEQEGQKEEGTYTYYEMPETNDSLSESNTITEAEYYAMFPNGTRLLEDDLKDQGVTNEGIEMIKDARTLEFMDIDLDKLRKLQHTQDLVEEGLEEEVQLIYPADSKEALEQFQTKMAARFNPQHRHILHELFDVYFELYGETTEDVTLDNLIAERELFFGTDCHWNTEVTFADLLIFYANRLQGNYSNYGYDHWMHQLLFNCDMLDDLMDHDDYFSVATDIMMHSHWNDETGNFGIFGLEDDVYYVNSYWQQFQQALGQIRAENPVEFEPSDQDILEELFENDDSPWE